MRVRSAALLAAVILAAGCGGGGQTTSRSPISVGFMVPLTGGFAALGQQEQNGWNLGLKEMGSTINGHKITTTFVDNQFDPNVSLTLARQLVGVDHVNLVEGPLDAASITALAAYLGTLHVPTDDVALCSSGQLDAYRKYHSGYASGLACDTAALIAGEWAYSDQHHRHVTTIGLDNAFGWTTIGGFLATFKKLGGTVDKEIWVPQTTSDFGPYMPQIPSNTDAVFAVFSGATAGRFTTAFQQFGLTGKVPLLGNVTLTDYAVLGSEVPQRTVGIRVASQYCDGRQDPATQKFANAYKAAYGQFPGYYAEAGYTKAQLLVAAVKKLGSQSPTSSSLMKAMSTTSILSPRGPVRMSTEYFAPIQNVYICEVQIVNGAPRNVPIKTYSSVPITDSLSNVEWTAHFMHDSAGRP